jgi:hypothetical protein
MGFSDEIIRRATGHQSLDSYRAYVRLKPEAVMRLVEERHTNDIQQAAFGRRTAYKRHTASQKSS